MSANKSTHNAKTQQLQQFVIPNSNENMTTNQGVGISNDQQILTAGERGPALLQDFIYREKVMHFDHERIPERVVHARGTGAHGYFQAYKDFSDLCFAHFLCHPEEKTPVFVRFSTVAGFRGSPDTVRDVRGFAVKFYTQEGNYDVVGNNMPVFFIQDAIKFPDLIHALKPEQHNEIPQAQSAHDTFWDFIANNPETAHNMMWLMSDRAIPKSYRTMDGFGIHTFKMISKTGKIRFVKLHFKSLQGVHSLVWEEAQKIAGKDPDFNRRDLWDAIDKGNYPEWELGVQILEEKDEFKFDFDILDSTKLWPEELIPITPLGKLTLNRNVTNFFAETEQVAFCPANLVGGIELTDDPLLQGRLFSYLDTQISRLGGVNFHEIPINKPIVPVNNNQRDGFHRTAIPQGAVAYNKNALNDGKPRLAGEGESRYISDTHQVKGAILRERGKSFMDFYTQPSMFYNSMSAHEKRHILEAFIFELGKCKKVQVRQAVVDMVNNIDGELSKNIAMACGCIPPKRTNHRASNDSSSALSMAKQPNITFGRKVAILVANGTDTTCLNNVLKGLTSAGAIFDIIAPIQGEITLSTGEKVLATQTLETTSSVLYDGLFVPLGESCVSLLSNAGALHFIAETFKHLKPILACGNAITLLEKSGVCGIEIANEKGKLTSNNMGVVTAGDKCATRNYLNAFITLLGGERVWERTDLAIQVIA